MAVKLRLRRMGSHKRPFYRVVVAESASPRDGRFIETVGTYNPLTSPPTTTLDADKVRLWLSRGAQPTEAVERILKWQGVSQATRVASDDISAEAAAPAES